MTALDMVHRGLRQDAVAQVEDVGRDGWRRGGRHVVDLTQGACPPDSASGSGRGCPCTGDCLRGAPRPRRAGCGSRPRCRLPGRRRGSVRAGCAVWVPKWIDGPRSERKMRRPSTAITLLAVFVDGQVPDPSCRRAGPGRRPAVSWARRCVAMGFRQLLHQLRPHRRRHERAGLLEVLRGTALDHVAG